ncbi:enoyl-CoA hydratase-related protein [Parahaliea aestuarii]|uniref:Enoyl-CoA hydratase n=1 Tax=Parahaliea aestuarii TaxID=1852021 RepID=A0A5C8ZRV8_9GAMM|nr:enoyl-CoA hydratase-related protein [Parahaliea aestuarii]TXS91176.1 enoyl-CoA hydratase [Parahaliea aestuarii]
MSLIQLQQQNHIAKLTLNDPERHNPISDGPMVDALCQALESADSDDTVRVIVLTAAGKSFSSGGNLKTMLPGAPGALAADEPAQTPGNYRRGIQRIPLLFQRLQKPVIAAVNGAAVGAGCDLACMCDLRIASTRARFAESFVKLGLIPGDGGAWLLQRIVGYAKAAELSLTGDMIDAQTALAIGLVSQVVEPDALLATALELADRIAANPPHAVQQTKRLLQQARDNNLAHHLEHAGAVQALMHTTAEHRDAVAAFLNKSN